MQEKGHKDKIGSKHKDNSNTRQLVFIAATDLNTCKRPKHQTQANGPTTGQMAKHTTNSIRHGKQPGTQLKEEKKSSAEQESTQIHLKKQEKLYKFSHKRSRRNVDKTNSHNYKGTHMYTRSKH